MRNLLTGSITFLCISLFSSCQKDVETEIVTVTDTVTIDLKRGLIAYYPFTGNANDSSGNNKHGNPLNGLAYSTDAHNTANKAANFDGVDDYIDVTDATNYFARPKMSVSFQFNLRDVTKRAAMLNKSAFVTPSAVSWGAGITYPNDPRFGFAVADGNNNCSSIWGTPGGSGNTLLYNTAIQNNTWYHVTLIFNLGVEMIYINGQLVSARVGGFSNLSQCTNANLKIGGWWQNDIVSITGKMDELRIYNRILAENEIDFLANEIN